VDNLYTRSPQPSWYFRALLRHQRILRQSQQQVLNGDDAYLPGGESMEVRCLLTSVKGKADLIGNPALGTYIEDGWVVAQGEPIVGVGLRMPENTISKIY